MDQDLTPEELDQRARELARRVRTLARAAAMAEQGKGSPYANPFRRFQAAKARARWRGVLGFSNPPPCQALALCLERFE